MGILTRIINYIKRNEKSNLQIELENLQKKGLKLGKNVDIYSEYPFDSLYPGLISVGNNVTISSNVKILAHDASMGYLTNGSCKIGKVDIGNNVFIGHGATILCNTRIGDYAVIGAGSVVCGDVPSRTVYAGNPARYIKTVEEFKNQHEKNMTIKPCFDTPWRDFQNFQIEEWEDIRDRLKDTYGYVVKRNH